MAERDQISLRIEGMHCASCVASIERGLANVPGIDASQVNLAMNSAVVTFDKSRITEQSILSKIEELGFKASVSTPDILVSNAKELRYSRQRFVIALVLSLPLAVFAMLPMLLGRHMLISPLIDGLVQAITAGIVLFYAGKPILVDALKQTRHVRANMNSLVAMGTLTAFFWSIYALISTMLGSSEPLYFDSAGMIITLILLGRFLEAKSRGRAGEAIQALLKLRPATARAVINGVELDIEPDMIRPGMDLLVRPGERIAADGVIVDGMPTLDESMLTGESVPVERKPGDQVIGGSLNGNTPFRLKVTAAGADSYLAMVIRMVSEAQGKKAPVQKLADKVAGVFVPIVISLAVLTLIGWMIFAPGNPMAVKAVIAVLIISCPCALGLATPTAVLAGTGRAARAGILVRGGDILETLSKVDAVVFDKTGTLTEGQLQVVSIKLAGDMPRAQAYTIIGSLESQSDHPLAKAITRCLRDEEFITVPLANVRALPGFGMVADYDGARIAIGSRTLMDAEQVKLGDAVAIAEAEMAKGRTVVYAAFDGQLLAVISLADKIRAEAQEVVVKLRPDMRKITMLSGDNHLTAGGVARHLGMDYEAEVRPEQKKTVVDTYRRAGYTVAMIGDGVNDAPALASADVGVAIGTGTDIAIEAADVVLHQSNLLGVHKMFAISRKTLRVIRQNLFWAFFYNVIAIPVAAGVFYPITGWTLSPMIAAAAMSFSSLFVVLNSVRLSHLTVD